MKRTKGYRPRRGMRFSNGRRGMSPTANFIGGSAITRSRPTGISAQNIDPGASAIANVSDAMSYFPSVSLNAGTLGVKQIGEAGNNYTVTFFELPSGTVGFETGSYSESPLSGVFFYNASQTTVGNFLANFPSPLLDLVSGTDTPNSVFLGDDGVGLVFFGGSDRVDGLKFIRSKNQVDSVGFTGEVQPAVLSDRFPYQPISPVISGSSTAIYGAISTGRNYERRKLDSILLGKTAASIPCSPFPSSIVMDRDLTGTLIIPSWTRASIGQNQAYVISALSSSGYDDRILNTFTSGSDLLETTAVPVSTAVHFSKSSRFQKLTVKRSASFFDTVVPSISGAVVPSIFLPGTGTIVNFVTGTLAFDPDHTPGRGNFRNPATFYIPVNQNGILTDLKVWVELVHMSGGPGFTYPLGNLSIALRHPSLRWGHAYPIRNDPALLRVYSSNGTVFNGDPDAAPDFYGPNVANYLNSTFLLWEGADFAGVQGPYDAEATKNGGFDDRRYSVWQRDRSMRVVFHDGAPVSHPRRHYNRGFVSGNFIGSPNAGVLPTGSAFGFDVPWTSDRTVFPGTESYQAAGSPPPGWLTGPGGTAAVNEWPTTGSNYGAAEMQPFLPLLDPLFARKRLTNELPVVGLNLTSSQALFTPDLWRGFRPGLRGTQISGTWELLIMQGQNNNLHCSAAFRQVRLEFTYETPPTSNVRQRANRRYTPRQAGPRYLFTMSGSDTSNTGIGGSQSASWDWYLTDIYTTDDNHGEVGRTFGVSVRSDGLVQPTGPALTYRLSGALADVVGNTPTWLLDSFTGMPAIPESSATLVPRTATPIASTQFNEFLLPRRQLDFPQSLRAVADSTNPPQSLRELASAFTASAAT